MRTRSRFYQSRGRPLLTPAEIRERRLRRGFRGYDTGAVDRLLPELFAACEEGWHERSFLESRARRLEQELVQSEELERRLREILISAQRSADELTRRTREEADSLVATARERAEGGRAEAGLELRRARAELARMHEIERELRSGTRLLVEEALRRLGVGEEEPAAALGPPAEEVPAEELPAEEPAPQALTAAGPPPAAPEVEEDTQEDTLSIPVAEAPWVEPEARGEPEAVAEPEPPEGFWEPEEPVRGRLFDRRSLVLSAGILATGVLVAVGVWQLSVQGGSTGGATTSSEPARTTVEPASSSAAPATATVELAGEETPVVVEVADRPAAPSAKLVLRAVNGDCWVQVRAGSATGKILYEGFLTKGSSERFVGRRFWLRLGAPDNLAVTLNGRRVRNLPVGTADVVVTAERLRAVSYG